MKTGKPIKVVNLNSSFSNEHGLFHPHGIQFEDGSGGVFNVKDGFEPKFKIGIEAGYESTPNGNHPNKVKYMDMEYEEKKAANPVAGSSRNTDSIIWQSCFKAVCSLNKGTIQEALTATDEAYNHCKALTENPVSSVNPTDQQPPTAPQPTEEDDDLPF